MEVTEIQKRISEKIQELEKGRKLVLQRAEAKAKFTAEYEKSLAVTILKLRNNMIDSFDGISCTDLPATLIEKVAKGICWKESNAASLAESEYKSAIVGMESLKSELNGYQSINRFLDSEA